MNIAEKLPEPLNSSLIDVPANEYYDFELPPDGNYEPITGCDFSLEVDKVKSLREQLKNGNDVRHELRHNEWGDTSFRIADLVGFKISFFTKDKD